MKKLLCIILVVLLAAPQIHAQKKNTLKTVKQARQEGTLKTKIPVKSKALNKTLEKNSVVENRNALNAIFKRYYAYQMEQSPEWASYNGIHTNSARRTKQKSWIRKLGTIDYEILSEADKLNYDLFSAMIKQDIAGHKFNGYLTPVGQQGGIHLQFPQIIEYQPVKTKADYQKYFSRLNAFPKAVDTAIEHMRSGLKEGILPPYFLMDQVVDQINNIKDVPVEDMPFMKVFEKRNKLDEATVSSLKKECADILTEVVVPAYAKLGKFMKDEYIPNCRKEPGIWSLPDGKERYAYAVKYHTSTDLTPDEIFNIGNAEVKRIKAQMGVVKNKIGYRGNLQDFVKDLRTNPKYYYKTKEPMLAEYRRILVEMDKQLPGIFGILPKAPYDLKEMEAYRAKSAPQAYYYPSPEDRSRPGYFYVNTTNLPARPKYTMTALALHEAPGSVANTT